MTLQSKSRFLRTALLWFAPVALLGGSSMKAQWSSPYGSTDEYNESRHHQHNEKHAIKDHQRQERYLYGNSWELRRHQQEERHQLKHHQRDERRYGEVDGYGRSNRDDGYYGRPY